ncbi:MAG: hypothetical protein AAGI92_05290 [Pseudomonadota bacterium]
MNGQWTKVNATSGQRNKREPCHRFLLIGAVVLGLFPSYAASDDASGRLNNNAIKTLILGKTLIGSYANGEPWRETYFIDEGLDYQDATGRSRGTWSVQENELCTFYDGDDLNGGCFVVVSRSANCHDFYAIEPSTGVTRATIEEMELGINWTARGWRSDRPSTCEGTLTS